MFHKIVAQTVFYCVKNTRYSYSILNKKLC